MADPEQKPYEGLNVIVRDANKLAARREELDQLRSDDTREWSLNRAFYMGNQWCRWNSTLGQVDKLPTEELPRWKVRLVSNQILPGVQHYTALMTKTKPVIHATPDSGSDKDLKAAQMGERLYEYLWGELNLKNKLTSALTYAQLSQGFWKITWDPLAGKHMTYVVGPDGKPIMDPQLSDIFLEELEQQATQAGQDPQQVIAEFKKTIYVGDIRVDALPGENVYLDPTANSFEEAAYAICKHALDPDEIKARWGVDLAPDSNPTEGQPSLWYLRNKGDRKPQTTRNVYIGYFRPTPALPKGRYVVWVEGPNKILEQSDWNYPFTTLPLVKFPGIERPHSVYDEARTTHARPLQKELNRTLSQIQEHQNLTLKPQMITPVGSLRQRLTTEPGAVFEYQPIGGMAPEWRSIPSIPAYVFSVLQDIQGRLDRLWMRPPSTRDAIPARSDSGYQLELMQEAVADQMSTEIQRLEVALAQAGDIMAKLAQVYYVEPRLLKIKGNNGSVQVKKFMSADLDGGFTFHAESGTGLPRMRAGRQQAILDLVNAKVLPPDKALRYLDLADMAAVEQRFQADEDMANREHEKLIKGEPISAAAVDLAQKAAQQQVQQAQQMLMQGINPVSQQPLVQGQDDPNAIFQQIIQQAQQSIQDAMTAPTDIEDWEAHYDQHTFYMKTTEFENLPLDAQERFIAHATATYQKIMSIKAAQAALDPRVAPKTSIGLKGTVSAPVLKAIFDREGIQVDEEQILEPPLETMVYDSIDQPDASGAGNNPLDRMEQASQMQRDNDAHAIAQADAAANLARSHLNIQNADLTNQHAQEKHDQAMKHAEEMHQVKKKQAAKPKPASSPTRKGGGQ